jgi:hypothetical protein
MTSQSFKVFVSIVLLTAAIIGVAVYSFKTLEQSAKLLDDHIVRVENFTRSGDWQKADQEFTKIEASWSGIEKKWAMLVDHIELDHIDNTLSKVSRYVETRDTPSALAEAAALRMYIKHIPEKEKLSWENLF